MKALIKLFLVCLLAVIGDFLFFSCSKVEKNIPVVSLLENALQQAGENRTELEKVLCRYQADPADSLKYRAACFLIENMPYYTYYKGKQLEQYLTYYTILQETRGMGISPNLIADSVRHMYGTFQSDSLQSYKDIETIDSTYLCNNIEWAFKVWQEQPWGSHVSFAVFCEYMLPYRIGDETLSSWRENIYKKYNPLLDSLRASAVLDKRDPIVAARCLLDSIRKDGTVFTTVTPADLPHVGPEVAQFKTGSCRESSDFVVYVCRALGIPCAIDFMPIRGDENDSHQWISFIDKYGTLYYHEFPNGVSEVRKDGICEMPKIKVYRNTFSLNHSMQEELQKLDTVIVPLFKNPHLADVTSFYTKDFKKELKIPESAIYKGKPGSRIAYLCASRLMEWEPVAWTKFDGRNLVFTDIQKGAVMRVATYERGRLRFWTDPFEINVSSDFHFFTPSDSVQDVTLFAKYNLRTEEMFRNRMIGGTFEGSNDPAFREKDILYQIDRRPERLQTVVQPYSSKTYRYVRYIGPKDSHCNIAEVAFYTSGDTIPLKGRIIGTPGCFQKDGSHEYTNVFDGDVSTSYDYIEPSGGWSGLDLGTPKRIEKILYTPRSYDNYIRPGDEYELFYCTKRNRWKSLGKQISKADSLAYKNVPANTLLLLKNHSRGIQERIFKYEKGIQYWK
ncbi:transglutaminase domain-containing protein [Bacteroides sp.]|uniref:transglutaminase domain-containing protein n=1 Tax=Bacteroides sp. TaxID=29523 RepID=UPI0026131A76|nr:transglutaminase domain-containing protein [Bacteroides sp.]MDD3038299.1 transglutaminase domain-containing protein [Bacteroides sp.]